jgi:hypothetical protein
VVAPLRPELLVGHPLLEHTVEPLAYVQQPVLEPASDARLGPGALVLVLEVVVVPDERLQLLAERAAVGDDVPRQRTTPT